MRRRSAPLALMMMSFPMMVACGDDVCEVDYHDGDIDFG
jgi:hypothetical protein